METKQKIRGVLREQYGNFNSFLEKEYANRIISKLLSENRKNKEFWATYNQVILELKNTLNDSMKVKELQYRLTDQEDPKHACIDILEQVKTKTPELERLYYKIRNFN